MTRLKKVSPVMGVTCFSNDCIGHVWPLCLLMLLVLLDLSSSGGGTGFRALAASASGMHGLRGCSRRSAIVKGPTVPSVKFLSTSLIGCQQGILLSLSRRHRSIEQSLLFFNNRPRALDAPTLEKRICSRVCPLLA